MDKINPTEFPMTSVADIDLDDEPNVLFERARDNLRQKQYRGSEDSRVSARYGDAGNAGWSPIPDVLLFNQHRLELSSDDLVVLLNLMAHYYVKNEMPFIRPTTIAKRMGCSQRSVQRSIARLVRQRLLWKAKHKENGHLTYDLTPLIEKLQPWGLERIGTKAQRQEEKRSVAQSERAPSSDSRF